MTGRTWKRTLAFVPVLLAATAWIRSYWFYDGVDFFYRRYALAFQSASDRLWVGFDWYPKRFTAEHLESIGWHQYRGDLHGLVTFSYRFPDKTYSDREPFVRWPTSKFYGRFGGFAVNWADRGTSGLFSTVRVSAPTWSLLIPAAILPYHAWRRERRQQRIGRFCEGCGYDLRASPDRCPECGRPVDAGAQTVNVPDRPTSTPSADGR